MISLENAVSVILPSSQIRENARATRVYATRQRDADRPLITTMTNGSAGITK